MVLIKEILRMDIKKLISIVVVLGVLGCSGGSVKRETPESINFLNYAYAICIGSAFDVDVVREDANRSANGYMQQGNISLEAYQALRSKVDSWLAKEYPSQSGGSLQIMKCNDFFNSGDIQKIYIEHDPCKSSEGWLDVADFNRQCS